jgi:hypothetical protein
MICRGKFESSIESGSIKAKFRIPARTRENPADTPSPPAPTIKICFSDITFSASVLSGAFAEGLLAGDQKTLVER